jgi:putative hydrolase of the HAD superfamily
MIRFIFFDLGNVLFRFNSDQMLRSGAEIVGCSVEDLQQLIYKDNWNIKLETGILTEIDFFEAINKAFNIHLDYEEFTRVFIDIFSEVTEIRPFLEYLVSIDFPCGILSNTHRGHWNHIILKYDYLTRLIPKNHVLSFIVGSMKPDKAIFMSAMDTAQKAMEGEGGLQKSEILFIDDLTQNIIGASNFGFDTIQFTNWQHVITEIKKRNLWHKYTSHN